jgi:D-alanyl-D-alanine carboxypeptidase/D-alanyl-D-alanine-endopeptidase (penicillin-binding protein 4)
MRQRLYVTLALLAGFTGMASANPFAQLQKDLTSNPAMHVGMVVLAPETGATLYQYQGEQYFHPASNAKLLTATAAMLSLGSDYHFITSLNTQKPIYGASINGNVYLDFSGDPSLQANDILSLLRILKQKGVSTINGNVILDNTIFPPNLQALGVIRDDSMWAYGAEARSIIIDENNAWVSFSAHTPAPQIQKVIPDNIKVTSNLTWETPEHQTLCSFNATPINATTINLAGCLPTRLDGTLGLALPDPDLYAVNLVSKDLASLGIKLSGNVTLGTMPSGMIVIAQHNSAPLSTLLTTMLKNSDNLYASAITKTMALKRYGIGGDKAGAAAIMDYLAPYQLPPYKLEDGAGRSYYDLVTPMVMAQLLYHVSQNPELARFLRSALPIVAVDGTLANFPTTVLKGKIIAKTGTMTDTSALSGFITTKSGRQLIFSLLIDDTPLNHKDLKLFQAQILQDLYQNF